jgi:iron complex outermembrane receptor protein
MMNFPSPIKTYYLIPGAMMSTASIWRLVLFGACSMALSCAVASPEAPVVAETASQPQTVQQDLGVGLAATNSLDEVIVTAQRRSERLKDVPISITAVTGQQLANQGVSEIQDLTKVVPGLIIDRSSTNTAPALRGVSTPLAAAGVEGSVAIYLDGVYQADPFANALDLPDVARIEVDKGPQGTLFGRNATGGAIQIFTLEPSFKPTGSINVTYGSFNERGINAFISGPLVDDVLAGSLSAYYDKNDGYYHDVLNGHTVGSVDSLNLRGKLKVRLSDSLNVLVTGFYIHRDDATDMIGQAWNGNTVDRNVVGAVVPTKTYNVAYNGSPTNNVVYFGGNVRATWEQPYGTFTATVSGAQVNDTNTVDADYGYTPGGGLIYTAKNPETTYTGELNFSSSQMGRFNFIAGFFAYHDEASFNPVQVLQDQAIPMPDSYGVSIFATEGDKSYAGYFEGHYNVTDRLMAIAGVRYSYEERNINGYATFGLIDSAPEQYDYGNHAWHSITPRASLRYAVDDSTNAYFTFSEGFKSGLYNSSAIPFGPPPAQVPPPVDPETLYAYEFGIKTTLFERLNLNSAIFLDLYHNQQVNAFRQINGIDLASFDNAAAAKIYGLDLDGTMAWSSNFTTRAGLSLLHARYTNYPAAVLNVPSGMGGNVEINQDVSGNQMIRSPNWTLTLSADYHQQFKTGTLHVGADVYHSDKIYFDVGDRVEQPFFTTLGAHVSWELGSSGMKVTAWGKNLTSATVIEGAFITQAADGVSYMAPRSVGLTLGYSF